MTSLYLSRARLRRDATLNALAALLVPAATAERASASHKLVWALFADAADRRRDFLWREDRPGHFMTLSSRPPDDPHGLFDLDTKPFEPALSPGDRLGFTLRVNPVVSRPAARGERGKRHDVVMDALRTVPAGERAAARMGAVSSAGQTWLARQGEAHGFVPIGEVMVDGYDRLCVPRYPAKPAIFGVLDISGVLEVRDPARFLVRVSGGFGHARAFGCGLMLIRRAR
ncbi:MAG TPA: type I-E CRISPR-associated protein Cas6/Cse3/CasE [Rhodopila sp.]|nr:type I-E CRISPR-associated protein Cas6/Cse3/CasE [Rhodopila sp.]